MIKPVKCHKLLTSKQECLIIIIVITYCVKHHEILMSLLRYSVGRLFKTPEPEHLKVRAP